MINITERYLVVCYTFTALLLLVSFIPLANLLCDEGYYCWRDFTIFQNTALDVLFVLIVALFIGLTLSACKGFLNRIDPNILWPKQYANCTFSYIQSDSKLKHNGDALKQFKKKYGPTGPRIFMLQSYLFLMRQNYNILMLMNVLLIVNTLGHLITALLISTFAHILIFLGFLFLKNLTSIDFFSLYIPLLIGFIVITRWTLLRFLDILFTSIYSALDDYFEYSYSKT